MSVHPLCLVRSLGALLAAVSVVATTVAGSCEFPQVVREATASEIQAFVRSRRMSVLTFTGYSGAEYEDAPAMLEHARKVLDDHNPAKTLVNIGATSQGIGAVYEYSKAKEGHYDRHRLVPCTRGPRRTLSLRRFCVLRSRHFVGRTSARLEEAFTHSAAIVSTSTAIVGIGGGEIARDEMLAARRAGKTLTFIPADMNHQLARKKTIKGGAPSPRTFVERPTLPSAKAGSRSIERRTSTSA